MFSLNRGGWLALIHFPECGGSHPGFPFEKDDKGAAVFEADEWRELGHRQVGSEQKFPCPVGPDLTDFLGW